ncbi:hypothetical protein AMECASPLE_028515 [Ameca splendens]|uniref:Uncharacterized protein n=1 Tax=Ameca splendens TaxID=208324 RepID=A0ABV0ZGC9_9TELE
MLKRRVSHNQPHNIQRLEVLRADLIHQRSLATTDLLSHKTTVTSAWVMDESNFESPVSASTREGVTARLRRSSKYFFHHPIMASGRGQQLPHPEALRRGEALLPSSTVCEDRFEANL